MPSEEKLFRVYFVTKSIIEVRARNQAEALGIAKKAAYGQRTIVSEEDRTVEVSEDDLH